MEEFEFISPTDKPALVAVNHEAAAAYAKTALEEHGFKVHVVTTHDQLEARFNQVNYQVVLLEEMFDNSAPGDNRSLKMLQWLPMMARRYCTFILVGGTFETFNPLQAYTQSVHCVVNYNELGILNQIIHKATMESTAFTNTYREIQQRIFKKGS